MSTLDSAQLWALEITRSNRTERRARASLRCAADAYRAAKIGDDAIGREAIALDTQCTRWLMRYLLATQPEHWRSTTLKVDDDDVVIDIHGLSPSLSGPPQLVLADSVSLPPSMGSRYASIGLGVPLVAFTPRCSDRAICRLFPFEVVTRTATAWVETNALDEPRLVITDPETHPAEMIGGTSHALSIDTSAPYAMLLDLSNFNHLGVWNLVGGTELERRQGLYLLQDYDPNKTPIVMLHGLGGSPMVWARLSNAILGSPDLRKRYQIWHIAYQTNAPVLIARFRVQQYLDNAWQQVDPEGHDPARQGVVLIGHSLGGVIARLLTSDSGDVLWSAAFTVPIGQLRGDAKDRTLIDRVFHFTSYPGVSRDVFLATPHFGSPVSDELIGRIALHVVEPQGPELDALRRVVYANLKVAQPKELALYQSEGLSSIRSLHADQPVSYAIESLMPVPGVRYYTIAGNLPGARVPGDDVVPLTSAELPGAVSTTVVVSGHKIYKNDEAIAKILEILREP